MRALSAVTAITAQSSAPEKRIDFKYTFVEPRLNFQRNYIDKVAVFLRKDSLSIDSTHYSSHVCSP